MAAFDNFSRLCLTRACQPKVQTSQRKYLMDFIDEIKTLATHFKGMIEIEHLRRTEEAAKIALVLPFLKTMGYSIFDPTEVVPELTAGVGDGRDKKVDFAIMRDAHTIIVIECKRYKRNLDTERYLDKLAGYFNATNAQMGILTDGITYRFFTDLDKPDVMDPTPFFEFNFMDYADTQVKILDHFTKARFNRDQVKAIAECLAASIEVSH